MGESHAVTVGLPPVATNGGTGGAQVVLTFEEPLPTELATSPTLTLNGHEIRVTHSGPRNTITLLGAGEGGPVSGLNVIQQGADATVLVRAQYVESVPGTLSFELCDHRGH